MYICLNPWLTIQHISKIVLMQNSTVDTGQHAQDKHAKPGRIGAFFCGNLDISSLELFISICNRLCKRTTYIPWLYIYNYIYISYLNRLFRYESNQQFANAALTVQLLDLLVFDMKTLPLEDTIARMFA